MMKYHFTYRLLNYVACEKYGYSLDMHDNLRFILKCAQTRVKHMRVRIIFT